MNLATIVLLLQVALSLLSAVASPGVSQNVRQQAINFADQAITLVRLSLATQAPVIATTSISQPIGVPISTNVEFPIIQPATTSVRVSLRDLDPYWHYYVNQSYNEELNSYNISFWFGGQEGIINQVTMEGVASSSAKRIEYQGIPFGFHTFKIRIIKGDKFAILEDAFQMQNTQFTTRIHPH